MFELSIQSDALALKAPWRRATTTHVLYWGTVRRTENRHLRRNADVDELKAQGPAEGRGRGLTTASHLLAEAPCLLTPTLTLKKIRVNVEPTADYITF